MHLCFAGKGRDGQTPASTCTRCDCSCLADVGSPRVQRLSRVRACAPDCARDSDGLVGHERGCWGCLAASLPTGAVTRVRVLTLRTLELKFFFYLLIERACINTRGFSQWRHGRGGWMAPSSPAVVSLIGSLYMWVERLPPIFGVHPKREKIYGLKMHAALLLPGFTTGLSATEHAVEDEYRREPRTAVCLVRRRTSRTNSCRLSFHSQ